jgi:hypothetical protein
MAFTKHTGIEEPMSKAKIVAGKQIDEAKQLVKKGSKSLIDAVNKTEEDEDKPKSV